MSCAPGDAGAASAEPRAHGQPGGQRDADRLADDEADEDRRVLSREDSGVARRPPPRSTPAFASANSGTITKLRPRVQHGARATRPPTPLERACVDAWLAAASTRRHVDELVLVDQVAAAVRARRARAGRTTTPAIVAWTPASCSASHSPTPTSDDTAGVHRHADAVASRTIATSADRGEPSIVTSIDVGVEDRDHEDRPDVVDDGEREQEELERRVHARAEQREDADGDRDVGRHRDAPAVATPSPPPAIAR